MMTVDQLSKKLNVTPNTVRKMARERKIPFIKLGYRILRFDEIEVTKYIQSKTVKPKK